MNLSTYIRPLREEDAMTSYKWRNNPVIWKWTGSRPDRYITPEIETEWIREVLKREDEKRFAVCLKSTHQYVGNIHLNHIKDGTAEYGGIFIGELEYWGKGFGTEVSILMLDYAFSEMGLEKLYARFHKENTASQGLFKKLGFETEGISNELINGSLLKSTWQKQRLKLLRIRYSDPNPSSVE